ncbi:MAG: death domain-containing protein, partial [Proteobacteria bacterium]|nr:death domain-containing protein [Pseudomonadota bacterium]
HTHTHTHTHTIDETPKPNQLIRLVGKNGEQISIRDHLAGNWEDLFLCLNFEPAEENQSMIAVIKRNNAGRVEDACRDVLLKWLAGDGRKPITWTTFVEVLKDMGESSLANKIEGILCQTSV